MTETQLQNELTWVMKKHRAYYDFVQTADHEKHKAQIALISVQRDVLFSLSTILMQRLRIIQGQPNT